tara:strand:+ start:354 stop:623 length:270 start_codon:yes stop_codon:yes gene_type:complete
MNVHNSIFGKSMYERLKIGDLVSWKSFVLLEDAIMSDYKRKTYGVVVKLTLEDEGNRKVAYATVLPADQDPKPIKILAMKLNIESAKTI